MSWEILSGKETRVIWKGLALEGMLLIQVLVVTPHLQSSCGCGIKFLSTALVHIEPMRKWTGHLQSWWRLCWIYLVTIFHCGVLILQLEESFWPPEDFHSCVRFDWHCCHAVPQPKLGIALKRTGLVWSSLLLESALGMWRAVSLNTIPHQLQQWEALWDKCSLTKLTVQTKIRWSAEAGVPLPASVWTIPVEGNAEPRVHLV